MVHDRLTAASHSYLKSSIPECNDLMVYSTLCLIPWTDRTSTQRIDLRALSVVSALQYVSIVFCYAATTSENLREDSR